MDELRKLAHYQKLHKRMTLKQSAEAILDRPEAGGWIVEVAEDVYLFPMKAYISPSASIERILQELAEYYAAELIISYDTKTVRFEAKH